MFVSVFLPPNAMATNNKSIRLIWFGAKFSKLTILLKIETDLVFKFEKIRAFAESIKKNDYLSNKPKINDLNLRPNSRKKTSCLLSSPSNVNFQEWMSHLVLSVERNRMKTSGNRMRAAADLHSLAIFTSQTVKSEPISTCGGF